ncbi:MAG: TonB-dependent receptor [Bacteroides sp.]|nr:TonB-dependent receptor [Bacteroides sp.]
MSLRFFVSTALLLVSWAVCIHASSDGVPSSPRINEGPDTLAIGEVTVTSIKQARSLLRQPVSVTTLNQREIERLNVMGMKGVSEIAPNFFMPEYGSRMTASVYVRGIGARIDQPAIGLNVDNVPYLNKDAYDFDMQDIQRIEVLRGPQSTLYGRNTIAGLINITTLSPLHYQGVRAMAEGATGNNCRLGASAYGLLSKNLGMSLSLYGALRGGYFKNDYNGKRADRETSGSMRWKTSWRPTDNLLVENVASYGHSRQNGYPYAYEETGRINYNDTCFYRRTMFTDGLTVNWSTPYFSLASITGFQYVDDNLTLDQDFLPESYFTLTQKQHDRSVTQDIVMRGSAGAYSWLAGVFGFYKYADMNAPVTFKKDGIDRLIIGNVNQMLPAGMRLGWDSDELLLNSDFTNPVKGIAVYHQSSYDWRNFTAAVGLRLDYEHTSLRYRSRSSSSCTMYRGDRPLGSVSVDIDDSDRLSSHFTQLLPKFSLTYNLPHSAIFASVSKGYKAGGYNTQMFSEFLQQRLKDEMMGSMGGGQGGRPQARETTDYDVAGLVKYRPEESWNYEIGGHFSVDQGRVYSSFALFLIDCRNQQLTMFPEGTTTGRVMVNAERTRSTGGEFTLAYTPTARWSFNLAYGYTHAVFRRFSYNGSEHKGNHLPYAPSNTLYLSATYRQPISSSILRSINLTADMRGTGEIYWDEANTYKQPFYAELGANVRFVLPWGSVDVWGKNLTDTHFSTFRYESMKNSFFQRGLPARGGVTLRVDFRSM